MRFNEIIIELRNNKNLSQAGAKLNMSQHKFSRMERGINEPSIDDLILLCKFYGVSADYLLGFDKALPFPSREID